MYSLQLSQQFQATCTDEVISGRPSITLVDGTAADATVELSGPVLTGRICEFDARATWQVATDHGICKRIAFYRLELSATCVHHCWGADGTWID